MKKVWVIENWIPVEKMQNNLNKALEDLERVKADINSSAEMVEAAEMLVTISQKILDDNPEGYWCGQIARTNYKDFCYEAKQSMYAHKDWKWRVVKADIAPEAEYWWHYTNPEVNEGVLRYLYATKWW